MHQVGLFANLARVYVYSHAGKLFTEWRNQVVKKSSSSYSDDPMFKSDDRLSRSSSIPLHVIHLHKGYEQPSVCVLFFGRITT